MEWNTKNGVSVTSDAHEFAPYWLSLEINFYWKLRSRHPLVINSNINVYLNSSIKIFIKIFLQLIKISIIWTRFWREDLKMYLISGTGDSQKRNGITETLECHAGSAMQSHWFKCSWEAICHWVKQKTKF